MFCFVVVLLRICFGIYVKHECFSNSACTLASWIVYFKLMLPAWNPCYDKVRDLSSACSSFRWRSGAETNCNSLYEHISTADARRRTDDLTSGAEKEMTWIPPWVLLYDEYTVNCSNLLKIRGNQSCCSNDE